jgi:hypothetical protein
MPLLLALPVGLLAGMSLAWLARAELTRSELPLALARPFLVAVALGALVFGPVVGYFAAFHGDWAYLYLVRWSGVPSAVDLVLVVMAAAQVPLGFALASRWAIAKRGVRLLQVAFAVAIPVAVASVLASRRLTVSATYAQYHGAFGLVPIGKSALGRGVLSSWIALSLAYAWSAHVLRPPRGGR